MIISADRESIHRIKNVYLLYHVMPSVLAQEDFRGFVKSTGVEIEEKRYDEELAERHERLKAKGAALKNDDKSVSVNRMSEACLACRKGVGCFTVDITHNCNRSCYHCFGDMDKIKERPVKYDYMNTLSFFERHHEIRFLGLSGGEPLLYKDDTVGCLDYVRKKYPRAHTRLYTNGDFIDRQTLKRLNEAGLTEIRFSIKPADFGDWSELGDKMALAKDFVPGVMVEMPVMPGTGDRMKEILKELDRIGVFGINLCEFVYCMHHAKEFNERGFRVKWPPYRIMYLHQTQYPGIPIWGSDLETLDLIEYAIDEGLGLGVHYCSLENRLTSNIYEMNKENATDVLHFSKRDFFLKSAVVAGEGDIKKALIAFSKKGVKDYRLVDAYPRLMEFSVKRIGLLKGLGMEVGIISSVVEDQRAGGPQGLGNYPTVPAGPGKVRKIVKIDVTRPEEFTSVKDL